MGACYSLVLAPSGEEPEFEAIGAYGLRIWGEPKCKLDVSAPSTKIAVAMSMRSTALVVVLLLTNLPRVVHGQGTLIYM